MEFRRKLGYILVLFLICVLTSGITTAFAEEIPPGNGDNLILFENQLPSFIESDVKSSIELSNEHSKFTENSLKWTVGKDGTLSIRKPIPYEEFAGSLTDQKRDSFVVWLYNETPSKDKLVFEFSKQGVKQCGFDFYMDFKGWRTAWVEFDRDMEGQPVVGMDQLTIKAPKDLEGETLYFSQFILATPLDARHQTRTEQTPFVNLEADTKANSHWMSLYAFNEARKAFVPTGGISEVELQDVKTIEKRYLDYLIGEKKPLKFSALKASYESYGIKVEDGIIKGKSIDYKNSLAIFDEFGKDAYINYIGTVDAVKYMTTMYETALFYQTAVNEDERKQAGEMYIMMFWHLYDQGFACGSSAGTVHHLGYDMRPYPKSVYLMEDVLAEAGWDKEAEESIGWFSGLGKIFYNDITADGVNMDSLNTLTEGMLASILIRKDEDLKAELLKQYTDWMGFSCSPKDGLMGPFKYDGLGYHHNNFYPAYTRDGMKGITPIIYLLRGTAYRMPEESHQLVKTALLNFTLFSNRELFLVGVSGRHPKGTEKFPTLAFRQLALSGSPDGTQEIDKDLAAAYMRLTDNKNDVYYKQFAAAGIEEQAIPVGNWSMNYAALGLHRRDDWLVGVRGYSKYLWGNETYEANNLYGRYISYGQIEIMNGPAVEIKDSANKVVDVDRSFHQLGWDWNSWPGITAIRLPMDELKSDVRNVDTFSGVEEMLISDEAYAGALDIEGRNGMFAMKLHEHPKYNGSHRARKSVFMFDNRVIALGSDIENNDSEHQTQTTLFQNYLLDTNEPIYVNSSKPILGLGYKKQLNREQNAYLLDNENIGYLLPEGQQVVVTRSNQESRDQNTGAVTHGDFAKAVIEHGTAPVDQGYEYMIVVDTTLDQLKTMSDKQRSESPIYQVLQKDTNAHIVKDLTTNTTGYALFEANDEINKGRVIGIDTPAMVMTKEQNNNLVISVADPDLRLYDGIDESQYDENGIQKEVSIYSREWQDNPSQMHTLNLVLSGSWKLSGEYSDCRIVSKNEQTTVLAFDTKDGKKVEAVLELENISINDDFERYMVGYQPENWKAENGTYAVAALSKEEDNQVLKVTSNIDKEALLYSDIQMIEEGMLLEFRIKTDSGSGKIALAEGQQEAVTLVYQDGSLTIPERPEITIPFEADKWHTIGLKLNPGAQNYELSVDGKGGYGKTSFTGSIHRFLLSAPKSQSVCIDDISVRKAGNTQLEKPMGLTYRTYGDTFVTLKWDTTDSRDSSYLVYINNQAPVKVNDNYWQASNLSPETSYSFTVQAVDTDNNYSEISEKLTVKTAAIKTYNTTIHFDDMEINEVPNDWTMDGTDTAGYAKVVIDPARHIDPATNSNAVRNTATSSNINSDYATNSNAKKNILSSSKKSKNAKDNINKALFVYSGTEDEEFSASYSFEKQTIKQSYKLRIYLEQCMAGAGFMLLGEGGSAAVIIEADENGCIGYKDGSSQGEIKDFLGEVSKEWIDFEIMVDPSVQKFSITADGKEVLNKDFCNQTAYIDTIRFNAPLEAGGIYVDKLLLPFGTDKKIPLKEVLTDIEPIEVPYQTDFYNLSLPKELLIKTEGDENGVWTKVNWNKNSYDANLLGEQWITGELAYSFEYMDNIGEVKLKAILKEAQQTYKVTIQSDILGGKLHSDVSEAPAGTTVTITAISDAGYELKDLLVNNTSVKTDNQLKYRFTLTEHVTISAQFIRKAKPSGSSDSGSSGSDRAAQVNWKKDAVGWWIQNADGTYPRNQWREVNGKWYYFGENGYMCTNWILLESKWYYLQSDGSMAAGWAYVNNKWYFMNQTSGEMIKGWQKINEKWYCLSMDTGECLIDVKTPDGYFVDQNGAWIE